MKRLVALVLPWLLAAPVPGTPLADALLLEVGAARRALELGEVTAAARGFRRAIERLGGGGDTALRRAELRLAFAQSAAAAGEVPLAHQHRRKAGALLLELARGGHPDRAAALRWLGELYRQGLGTDRSPQKAARHLLAAARLGDRRAQVALAELLLGRKGRAAQGYRWALEAAEAGDPRGAFLVGTCRAGGLGCPADLDEARRWLRRAAARRAPGAASLLARLGAA